MSTKLLIWIFLSVILGVFIKFFHTRYLLKRIPLSKRSDNKLGKAMINMERASIFGDYMNFFEFSKYAIKEAMNFPRGKDGMRITLNEVISRLEDKEASDFIISTVKEIYQFSESVEKNEYFDGDLSEKLGVYYKVIREIKNLFS